MKPFSAVKNIAADKMRQLIYLGNDTTTEKYCYRKISDSFVTFDRIIFIIKK